MSSTKLASKRYAFDTVSDAVEHYLEAGWTDGLPIVPPTEDRVAAMLDAGGIDAEEIVLRVPLRAIEVSAEKIAINATMAGCKPEYFPVVLAAIDAINDPAFNIHGPAASTESGATLVIVSGPIAEELGINGQDNAFGPGWRANATIGRTMRLVIINCLGAKPGTLDRSCMGNPAKYGYCVAEDWTETRWVPHHVELGFKPEESTVTVCATESPIQVSNRSARSAERILSTYADTMTAAGINAVLDPQQEATALLAGMKWVVAISPEHRETIIGDGWSKQDVRNFLFEKVRRSVGSLKRAGRMSGDLKPEDEETLLQGIRDPNDTVVISAGGPAGKWGLVIPNWGGPRSSIASTRLIHRPIAR